jgi:bifunctional non-homologous end joining protein LigD
MPRGSKRPRSPTPPSASLEAYDEKRDFARTAEPPPKLPATGEGPLTFVVQKHAARQLHYDFRLELDGVLKSWSVPRGPSLDTDDKRLAVMVEDHPLDYASFEGIIPKGEYGAGQVIVWDNGTYSPDEGGYSFADRAEAEERMRLDLAGGKLSITLRGHKLKGSWTLVKMQRGEHDWLLIKHRDAIADAERDITGEDRSVVCGLSIEDLKNGHLPPQRGLEPVAFAALPNVRRAPLPEALAPMLATPASKPFSDPAWLFEPKLDGVRTIAILRDSKLRLLSRRGLEVAHQYPALAAELAEQPAGELVLDGEIVAPDEDGRPSFELLQQRLNLTREADIRRAEAEIAVLYFAFDCLHIDGYDLRRVPLEHRRAVLERVLAPSDRVRLLEQFAGEGEAAYNAAVDLGLEGVVAKRRAGSYRDGQRSPDWLKIKSTQSDEFVVGGYTAGQGNRAETFGALLLGQYEDGKLVYRGSVGSGFDDRTLASLRERLDAIAREARTFTEEPSMVKGPITWVEPELVAEVKFAQRTNDGLLRAPVFLRLRDDMPAQQAQHVEVVAPVSTASQAAQPAPATQADVDDLLAQLAQKKDKLTLVVQGHKVPVTNLDKEFWPKLGRQRALTKRDLLVYLTQVSPVLLPHLRDRPLTLTRYPNGIAAGHFYQKHIEQPRPEFAETVRVFSSHNEGDSDYLLCNNLPTLLWLGQLADLELHTWYSRVSPEPDGHGLGTEFWGSEEQIDASLLNYPDFIVLDLDPYIYSGREARGEEPELNKKAFAKTREVALWLKDILDTLGLSSFLKTSGRTGLHIYAPILRNLDYDVARAAAEAIGKFLLQQHPRDVTMEWTVDKRAGKVFFDHNQNVRGKTLASVYSPRPLPEAAVSMPLRWDELADVYPTDFTLLTAPQRIAEVGDLWSGILDAKKDLAAMLRNVAKD